MPPYIIRHAESQDFPAVIAFVEALLAELGEEGDEAGTLANDRILKNWLELGEKHIALMAETPDGSIIGVVTLVETFAIYANGYYGVINEMYVVPGRRSSGIGTDLIAAVAKYGRSRGWHRIDVTAPESDRWIKTSQFYKSHGFIFTGPKLKLQLDNLRVLSMV
jgi:GNAT superfamily N-acetyltransferase